MRVFKTKKFAKWAKKNMLSDKLIFEAATEILEGSFEVNLGGSVLKKRVATKGRGKRGSSRTIVIYKSGKACFFVYGFEKNEKGNISENEEKAFKMLAKKLLSFSNSLINKNIRDNSLVEVCDE